MEKTDIIICLKKKTKVKTISKKLSWGQKVSYNNEYNSFSNYDLIAYAVI